MTPNPYQTAYEAAIVELNDISARFEQLRMRKGQVEHLIVALQSVFGSQDGAIAEAPLPAKSNQAPGPAETPEPAVEIAAQAEPPAGYSYMDVPNPLPESDGDPFQRRVKTSFRFKGLAAQRSF